MVRRGAADSLALVMSLFSGCGEMKIDCQLIAKDILQREVAARSRNYALRFIAVLVMAAACCAGLVSSIIWLTDQ